eukprot:jgi/Galph1/5030/GphlegSOOS_G50.1
MLRALYWIARTREALEPNLKANFSRVSEKCGGRITTTGTITKVFTGDAMSPTINEGVLLVRRVVIRRLVSPSDKTVFIDDIVVCRDPTDEQRNYVRRVIAMSGEEMVSEDPRDISFCIPPGHCWVVRDNDNAIDAADSRNFGPLSFDLIKGRVLYSFRSQATSLAFKNAMRRDHIYSCCGTIVVRRPLIQRSLKNIPQVPFISLRDKSKSTQKFISTRKQKLFRISQRMAAIENTDSNQWHSSTFPTQSTDLNYVSPLSTRYASKAMRANFADLTRFRLWRKLWIALAESQRQLGLESITEEQLDALRNAPDVDIELAQRYEKQLRTRCNVTWDQVPIARPIIHLGATSCFVTDNSELFQDCRHLLNNNKNVETLAFTHFQPAQPTTVGKRACLWIQDFLLDLLDHMVTREMGFEHCFSITGQTYTRKQDYVVVSALAGIGQSAAKMANDIRLLQHMKEVEDPLRVNKLVLLQWPIKNPMRCERINALARFLQSLTFNPAETASTQCLERSLDDSAKKIGNFGSISCSRRNFATLFKCLKWFGGISSSY